MFQAGKSSRVILIHCNLIFYVKMTNVHVVINCVSYH